MSDKKSDERRTRETSNLAEAYVAAIGRHGAVDCAENRAGYFKICETLEEFRCADFDEYMKRLDVLVPLAFADA